MFAKLLKHEWKATRGVLGILTLCAIGVGVLELLAVWTLTGQSTGDMESNPFGSLLLVSLSAGMGLGYLALMLYVVAVQVILWHRFYKNKFTDEGYLTFTLPVKVTQIYWASLVNMFLWLLIACAVALGIVVLVAAVGLGELVSLDSILYSWEDLLGEITVSPLTIVLEAVDGIANLAYFLVLPLACITGGAVLAKKHKILAAFGVYFGACVVRSIASDVVAEMLYWSEFWLSAGAEEMERYYQLSAGLDALLFGGLAIVGYALTIHWMKRKLNLP